MNDAVRAWASRQRDELQGMLGEIADLTGFKDEVSALSNTSLGENKRFQEISAAVGAAGIKRSFNRTP
jgi:hypothetical protein